MRPGRCDTLEPVRAPSGVLLVVLLAAAPDGAEGQGLETAPASVPPAREPRLGLRKAQLLGAAAGLALGAALAHERDTPMAPLRPLRAADAILTGSAAALYLGGGLFDGSASDRVAPTGRTNGFDRKIRRLAVGRRSLENRRMLDHLSSTTLMVALFQPIGMLVAADVPHRWTRDLPVMAEATAVTISVNAFVKHLTHRSRPSSQFCESEHIVVPCPPDTRLSFFSGHTSSAFAAAVAAGTIADFHRLENRKWIWASGLTFATATGVLRVMSDQHYATDVLTGMAAGGLAGWLIPKLHKPDETAPAGAAAARRPGAMAAVPLLALGARSSTLVTAGSVGGGPYVGIQRRW